MKNHSGLWSDSPLEFRPLILPDEGSFLID